MGSKQTSDDPRMSYQSLKLLNAFLAAPTRELSGADLISEAGIPSGTLYPLLYRFEEAGLLSGRWEKKEPQDKGRPLRKLYRMTGRGLAKASEVRHSFLKGVTT